MYSVICRFLSRLLLPLLVVAAAGCSSPSPAPTPFDVARVSSAFTAATVELTGQQPGAGTSLRAAVDTLNQAVADTSSLDSASYRARWDRSPTDAAVLAGRWLAMGIRELDGADLRLLEETRDHVNVALPNEPADNPRLANAQSLRSTFQSAFAAEAA